MSEKEWCYYEIQQGFKVKIDSEDLARVSSHKWRVTKGTQGRSRVVTSIRGPKGARSITLGKFLMSPAPGMQVYPRRFNQELDYRKSNLIVCTVQERQRLLPKTRTETTSRYRGVSFSKREKKWRAAIKIDKRTKTIGYFDSEDEAALAYNRAAREHFGEMAYQTRVGQVEKKRRVE
jgi:hypothetical protein